MFIVEVYTLDWRRKSCYLSYCIASHSRAQLSSLSWVSCFVSIGGPATYNAFKMAVIIWMVMNHLI